jgi:type I phosphodiesterase/nucleotide pyrophosphatase
VRSNPRSLLLLAVAAGVGAAVVTFAASVTLGVATGVAAVAIEIAIVAWSGRKTTSRARDPGRRRFLAMTGAAGLAWVAGGTVLGAVGRRLSRPDPRPIQEAMASGLGAEYMELVRRAYHPDRSGDLQLLLAPYNSANYENESTSLVPRDPRTSHASVWMYLERIPLVVVAPGRIAPSDSIERVSLADLAPTTAELMGFDGFPLAERSGSVLPGIARGTTPPKVIVTFVIDGGGWNVLDHWNGRWPTLKRLMREGANFRNALTGSFPAVTACAHATIGTGSFPGQHGITGHNIRVGNSVRKAYRAAGAADPSDILLPTLADLWSDETDNRAWVGELGYQVWHLGMIGFGGRGRSAGEKPVGVFWDEAGGGGWAPHQPDLYRLPAAVPGLDVWQTHRDAFQSPDWDAQFDPKDRQDPCCEPPIAQYQGDLIEATFDSEPIGQTGTTDLLYINFKTPDYTGHIYNMQSRWEGLMLEAVDAELGRIVRILQERFPGDYALIVTADHGQCPLPEDAGGVRVDPIQLKADIDREFGGVFGVVQEVVPSEVYLHRARLWDVAATPEDVAAFLRDHPYRRNIGPYVPRNAIEQDLLDQQQFAAVFATSYLDTLDEATVSSLGETRFKDADPLGIPSIPPD